MCSGKCCVLPRKSFHLLDNQILEMHSPTFMVFNINVSQIEPMMAISCYGVMTNLEHLMAEHTKHTSHHVEGQHIKQYRSCSDLLKCPASVKLYSYQQLMIYTSCKGWRFHDDQEFGWSRLSGPAHTDPGELGQQLEKPSILIDVWLPQLVEVHKQMHICTVLIQ